MNRLRPIADGRRAGQRRADDVEVARRHVREVPERRHVRAEMRVVGEQRLAACGERAVDDPVVRAERFDPPPPSSCCCTASWPPSALRERARTSSRRRQCGVPGRFASPDVRSPPASGRSPACRVEDAQAVARIRRHQLGGPLRPDAREQVSAQELVRVVGAEIPRHHLDPHQDVGPGPRRRLEAQQRELRRQRAGSRGEKRIHAGDVRLDLRPGIVRQPLPRGARRAAESDRAEEPVLRNRRGAEDFRQPAVADPALKLHLPQPVLGMDEAEAEERVALRRGEDVRDGVGVAHDLDRPRQSLDANRAARLRQRAAAGRRSRRRARRCYDDDENADGDQ